jgi:hypothetical protein
MALVLYTRRYCERRCLRPVFLLLPSTHICHAARWREIENEPAEKLGLVRHLPFRWRTCVISHSKY